MTQHVQSVSTKDFDEVVRQSDVPVIVDVWAAWCGPCRMLAPLFEKFARQYHGVVKFVKINKDENPEIAEEFEVTSIPRLLIFNGAERVTELVGLLDYPDLRNWVEEQIIELGLALEDSPENHAAEIAFEAAVIAAFATYEEAVKQPGAIMGKAIKPLQDEFAAYKKQLLDDEVSGDELANKLQEKGAELNQRAAPALEEYKKVSEPAEAALLASIADATDAFLAGSTSSSDTAGGDGDSNSTTGRVCAIDDPTCQS